MAVAAKKISLAEFVQLEAKWKIEIAENTLNILSDELAQEFGKTTGADISYLRKLARNVILKKEPYMPLAVPDDSQIYVNKKITSSQKQYEVIIDDKFLLFYAPSSYTEGITKEEEATIYRNCYSTFISSYPNLKADNYIMLEVDNETKVFAKIEVFIVNNSQYSMRHIILMGHGDPESYCLKTEESKRTFLKRDTIIGRIDAIHDKHLTGSLERSTKTIIFFCMCYGHCHCDANHPATQCVAFTTDEKPHVLLGFDKCFDLQKYAALTRANKSNTTSGVLSYESQENMEVDPATQNN